MELKIKHPNSSESFLLDINISKKDDETIYKILFKDKRLSESYGTVELRRKPNNFWKFPENSDNFLNLLLFDTVFRIMNNEVEF